MAKLTKRQKNAVEMLAIYTVKAEAEFLANGLSKEYESHTWMCVQYREKLGLDVLPHDRKTADKHFAEYLERETA